MLQEKLLQLSTSKNELLSTSYLNSCDNWAVMNDNALVVGGSTNVIACNLKSILRNITKDKNENALLLDKFNLALFNLVLDAYL